MTEPRTPRQDWSFSRSVGSRARQVGRAAAQFDIDLGPFESALGTVIGVIAGMVVATAPIIILDIGPLIPLGLLVGGTIGWLAARTIRGRLTFRGWPMGVVGVVIVGLLTICATCTAFNSIANIQNTRISRELAGPELAPLAAAYGPSPTATVVYSIFGWLVIGALIGLVIRVLRG